MKEKNIPWGQACNNFCLRQIVNHYYVANARIGLRLGKTRREPKFDSYKRLLIGGRDQKCNQLKEELAKWEYKFIFKSAFRLYRNPRFLKLHIDI